MSITKIPIRKRFEVLKQVLNGTCLKVVAKQYNTAVESIEYLIHSRCFEIAPDFYKTGRRIEKRSKQTLALPPTITWLRENKEKFIGPVTP